MIILAAAIPTITCLPAHKGRHSIMTVSTRRYSTNEKPLADIYPEFYELLSILDPLGTASIPTKHFLTDDWISHNGFPVPPSTPCYALIYEWNKVETLTEDDKLAIIARHDDHCAQFHNNLLKTLDVSLIDLPGKVFLWAAAPSSPSPSVSSPPSSSLLQSPSPPPSRADQLALRSVVLSFIRSDPLVRHGLVGNWLLLQRNELISYIKGTSCYSLTPLLPLSPLTSYLLPTHLGPCPLPQTGTSCSFPTRSC